MGQYQKYRGDSETKLFYLIDDLYGGVNTEYSDDASQNGEFRQLLNFDLDKRGTLKKRKGFGKLDALSQIFQDFVPLTAMPQVRLKSEESPTPELTDDNLVYMKLLRNDNNCFRNLAAFGGEKAYREYQKMYGFQNNVFDLLLITSKLNTYSNSYDTTVWRYTVTLPEYTSGNDTISVVYQSHLLPTLSFKWDRNLINIDSYEFGNKIYFGQASGGILIFDKSISILEDAITYANNDTYFIPVEPDSSDTFVLRNSAYKPTPSEAATIGFNLLGYFRVGSEGEITTTPIGWLDTDTTLTSSIQGLFIFDKDGKSLDGIPYDTSFKLGVLFTGTTTEPTSNTFLIEAAVGADNDTFDANLSYTYDSGMSKSGAFAVYDVTLNTVHQDDIIKFKVTLQNTSIDPLIVSYNFTDKEGEALEPLHLNEYRLVQFNKRALYYKGNMMYFSVIDNPTYIPEDNYYQLSLDTTDEIVKIIYFRNVYIIFTKYKIYKMVGDFGDSDFAVSILNDSLGCCAANTVVPIENVIYFASNRGLHMLTSNYSYNTSTNALTFENVKELDDKVKTLTSDFTYYIGELVDPTIHYNGISSRAVAFRYKDTYMLIYNTFLEEGDYAAENKIDALSYNYELKAFTTIRFTYKPTFLFLLDNNIEVYTTNPRVVPTTGWYPIVLYDGTYDGKYVVDKSNHGNNSEAIGDITLNEGDSGAEFNGTSSYISIDTVSHDLSRLSYDNKKPAIVFNITCDYRGDSDCTIIDLQNSDSSSSGAGRFSVSYSNSNDKLTLQWFNNQTFDSYSLETDNNIGFLGLHTWYFYIDVDNNNIYIKKDDVVINSSYSGVLALGQFSRGVNHLGCSKFQTNFFKGIIKSFSLMAEIRLSEDEILGDTILSHYFNEPEGELSTLTFNAYNWPISTTVTAYATDCTMVNENYILFNGGYLRLTSILDSSIPLSNGFRIRAVIKCSSVDSIVSMFEFSDNNLNHFIRGLFNSYKYKIDCGDSIIAESGNLDLLQKHDYLWDVRQNEETGYTIKLYVDDVEVSSTVITDDVLIKNLYRELNTIGSSSVPNATNFLGKLYSFTFSVYYDSTYGVPLEEPVPTFYEYGITYNEFDNPIEILLETKGYNLGYPQHIKKLKKLFVKAIGGYNYQSLFLEVYRDNFRVNTCGVYDVYTDENNVVVYEFTEEPNLKLQPSESKYDIMKMDDIKLGKQLYQLRKFATPAKGKNFSFKIYGSTADALEIESFGLVCKLGKVKE